MRFWYSYTALKIKIKGSRVNSKRYSYKYLRISFCLWILNSLRRWIWDLFLSFLFNKYPKPPLTSRWKKFTGNTKFPTNNGIWFCIVFACWRWNQHNYKVNLKNHMSSLRLLTPTGASSHFIYIVHLWWGYFQWWS